jgi:hypothetical protein
MSGHLASHCRPETCGGIDYDPCAAALTPNDSCPACDGVASPGCGTCEAWVDEQAHAAGREPAAYIWHSPEGDKVLDPREVTRVIPPGATDE